MPIVIERLNPSPTEELAFLQPHSSHGIRTGAPFHTRCVFNSGRS